MNYLLFTLFFVSIYILFMIHILLELKTLNNTQIYLRNTRIHQLIPSTELISLYKYIKKRVEFVKFNTFLNQTAAVF